MATAIGRGLAPARTRTALARAPVPARVKQPRGAPAPPRLRHATRETTRPNTVRRRTGGLTIAAVGTVCALVFAVVFHVVLAQSQLELDQLTDKIARAQRTYESRRLEVAKMSAPERIITAAQNLGLELPPDPPMYLTVPGAPVPAGAASQPATTLTEWKVVKPHLGDSQP